MTYLRVLFSADFWQELYSSIRKNKLRTALTLIGVSWGMFLFIILLGMARGMENGFNDQFDGLASNSFFLWGSKTSVPYEGFPRGRQMNLTLDDVSYLTQRVHGIKNVVPRNVMGSFGTPLGLAIRGLKSGNFQVYGDYPELNKFQKVTLIKGRFINQKDIDEKRKVIIIGERVFEELFEADENPLGQYIQIAGIYFEVVGLYKDEGQGWLGDDSIFMPFLTFQTIFNQGKNIGWLAVTGNDDQDIKELEKQVKGTLKEKYKVSPLDNEAFGSFNLGELFGQITGFLKGMQVLTISVGILTILAGVIAISNILLITVTERTKEIGIRRAIGAKPAEVRAQIMMESVVLTLFAGIMGFILATLILAYMDTIPPSESFPFSNPTVSPSTILIAIFIMVGLGLFIGMIPAQRAVKIKPIEALRSE